MRQMTTSKLVQYQRYYSEILLSGTLQQSLCILVKTNWYPAQSDKVHPKGCRRVQVKHHRDLLYDKAALHVPSKVNESLLFYVWHIKQHLKEVYH